MENQFIVKVMGNSMLPILLPNRKYKARKISPDMICIGDIIVYNKNFKYIVAHRVIDILKTSNRIIFFTKGDNNFCSDDYVVFDSEILGIVCL